MAQSWAMLMELTRVNKKVMLKSNLIQMEIWMEMVQAVLIKKVH